MNSHERILTTLERRPADRTPVDVWLTPEVLESLSAHVGEPDEYDIYRKLGVDKIAWVFPGYGTEKYDPNVSQGIDPWGVPTVNVVSGLATYQEYGTPPLGEMASPDEIDNHLLWPDPERFNYAAAKATAERARVFGFATIETVQNWTP